MTNNPNKGSLSAGYAADKSQAQNYNEEISMEILAKQALDQTIKEGGAFARENSDQFKQ
ncbi:hypothetical protein KDJ21_019225 [Metabacillus litoralis]|uniref:hypothetical protein n=1 Tax=Metabacillus TaxID=2675233 RepID=UPI0013CE7F33|nr:hypothetical protein [Metabacillus litoralis]MCM3163345.1 hypothetical protein [Metabacillus litoralis]MCM3409472.1 hypothetical protein [Metabacillus litoralis]UHA58938.1 hypothetical protein KDJ21_019225 [Metabacillus litoralis]